MSELRLSQNERKRRFDEGFGNNDDGDNEYVFGSKGESLYKKQVEKVFCGYVPNSEDAKEDNIGEEINIKVESKIYKRRT